MFRVLARDDLTNSAQKYFFTIATFFGLAFFSTAVRGELLRFTWTDDFGDSGAFTWETNDGFTPSAIVDFQYILIDESPTPVGFLPNTFQAFNNNRNWDLNVGVEGVALNFATNFSFPLPESPVAYESAFDNGQFITQANTRSWREISVVVVPEPNSAICFGLSVLTLLASRTTRSRATS